MASLQAQRWGSKGDSGKGDGIGNEVDSFHCDGACFSAGLRLRWMDGRKFQAVRLTKFQRKLGCQKSLHWKIIIDADPRWLWES